MSIERKSHLSAVSHDGFHWVALWFEGKWLLLHKVCARGERGRF